MFGGRGVEIVLPWLHPSPRFKQVAHPAPRIWMHYMEIRDVSDLDDEITALLREAYDHAG